MIPSLTKLSLKLWSRQYSDHESDTWDVQDLRDLLHSQSSLEYLALEFEEGSTFNFHNVAGDRLELPSINSLSLHWHATTEYDLHYPSSDVPRLFEELGLENVKAFRFKLSLNFIQISNPGSDSDTENEMPLLDEQLAFFLADGGRFPLLDSFHLEMDSTDQDNVCLPTSYIQNIKLLSLQINSAFSMAEGEDDPNVTPTLPQLERLTLRNCYNFRRATVQTIVDAVKEGGNWANFQKLLVHECPYLSWSSLQDIVEPAKLEVFSV